MSLKPNIKQVLSIIKKALSQAPIDKQPFLTNKLARIMNKY